MDKTGLCPLVEATKQAKNDGKLPSNFTLGIAHGSGQYCTDDKNDPNNKNIVQQKDESSDLTETDKIKKSEKIDSSNKDDSENEIENNSKKE